MAEGNFGARDQINLQDSGGLLVSTNGDVIANCNNCNDLQLLETAFGERLAALGGRAVVLESLVKAIRESGYQGTEQQAATTLLGSGRFSIGEGPSGRLIAWKTEGDDPQR